MSIIGISGKINSGKDLVGEIIQYISYKKRNSNENVLPFNQFQTQRYETRLNLSRYEIHKYGGKLKDIVCILLNCTREDLEDRDFKETKLGPEWKKYVLCYVDKYSDMTNIETFLSKEEAEKHLDELNVVYFHRIEEIELTARLLLQLIGTECGRTIIHPNIWVTSTLSSYDEIERWRKTDEAHLEKYNNWIVTDVRFPNEAEAIKNRNGILIRINREIDHYGNPILMTSHPSEYSLDEYDGFNHVIENNGSIDELIQKIEKII